MQTSSAGEVQERKGWEGHPWKKERMHEAWQCRGGHRLSSTWCEQFRGGRPTGVGVENSVDEAAVGRCFESGARCSD